FLLFFNPQHKQPSIQHYETIFSHTLTFLHQIHQNKCPQHIPKHPKDPLSEFSFHPQPIFVLSSTPAHSLPKSRKTKRF
ncbi:YqcI/YcgG family protein, partial [Priestia megaterium]|uniref:YqcI/YcgG family protein n=1 Tax=Priestia megaterium TaxID=1404 RepID=UPI0012B7236F